MSKYGGVAVADKIGAFEEWLQRSDSYMYDRHGAQIPVVKHAVKVGKRSKQGTKW